MVFHIPASNSHTPLPRDAPSQHLQHQQVDAASLVSALHAAFESQPSNQDQEMVLAPCSSKHPSLEIAVSNDHLLLRGTGADVEPVLLSGNVILNLSEPTSVRQINLVFRGKARLPSNPNDPHVLGNSPSNYVICTHEWSFLEGEKRHNHTLKAGRHVFPFELRIGGSLPSSLTTFVNGGATIFYKLRATAVRPGFSSNLTASLPVTITRTFASESLEYQQTLEIENTWPEKIMYALMIPHKAWAAGDEFTALVKFSPLAKGVRVLNVTTNISETTRTVARGGYLEKTRNVATKKHEFIHGRPVSIDDSQRRRLRHAIHASLDASSYGRHQAMLSSPFPPNSSSHPQSGTSTPGWNASGSGFISGISTPILEGAEASSGETNEAQSSRNSEEDSEEDAESEIVAPISLQLPPSLTPSHPMDPIIVSYRVRWSILLGNLDGHTSELRCSLPIHVLDKSLLDEARRATLVTRRLLLGGPEEPEEEEMQLPSYPSHVRDRVAVPGIDGIVPIPPSATVDAELLRNYVPEPFESGTSTPAEHGFNFNFPMTLTTTAGSVATNGATEAAPSTSPSSFGSVLTSQPPSFTVAMWPHPRHDSASSVTSVHAQPSEESASRPTSRHERGDSLWSSFSHRASRTASRANSRAASPERSSTGLTTVSTNSSDETHPHSSNSSASGSGGRHHQHGLLSSMMKPLMSIGNPWSHSHGINGSTSSQGGINRVSTTALPLVIHHTIGGNSLGLQGDDEQQQSQHRHFIDVPVYTPSSLTSNSGPSSPGRIPNSSSHSVLRDTLRGLPTYEDSEAQVQRFNHLQRSREASDALPLPSMRRIQQLPREDGTGDDSSSISAANRSFSEGDLVSHFGNRGRVGSVTQRA